MLCLSRKKGEKLVINGNIIVEVVEFHGGNVRLGVTAPSHIVIDREEIHHARTRYPDADSHAPDTEARP